MKILSDIKTKTYKVEEEFEYDYQVVLRFGFRDNGKLPVEFTNMAYGFTVSSEEEKIYEEKRPFDSMTFLRTDEDFIEGYEVYYLIPEKKYIIEFWTENDGDFWQSSYTFTLPRPKQPYPSWIYNEEYHAWESPVPIPDDEANQYNWDEQSLQWIKQ